MKKKSIGGMIKYISDKVRQKADNNLKDHNVTLSQVRVLNFLWRENGSCSQKQIEDFLQVSHPTVVGLVSRMEQSGYIQTSVSPDDKRNKIVTVTDSGMSLACELCRYMEDIDKRMLVGLTDEQQAQLAHMLYIVAQNFE